MGLPVVKHVPLAVHAFDAAVVVGRHVETVFLRPAVQPHVAVGDQNAAEMKVPIGIVAHRVGEHMAVLVGVDKVIAPVDLADGAGLVKGVALKLRAVGHELARKDALRLACDREHVVRERHRIGSHDVLGIG